MEKWNFELWIKHQNTEIDVEESTFVQKCTTTIHFDTISYSSFIFLLVYTHRPLHLLRTSSITLLIALISYLIHSFNFWWKIIIPNHPLTTIIKTMSIPCYAYILQCLHRCLLMQKQQIKPTGKKNIAQKIPQQVNSDRKLCLQPNWLPVCTIWIVLTICCCCCCTTGCVVMGGWMIGGPRVKIWTEIVLVTWQ